MDELKCIDNKEIFIEVLHLAIDYLIGNINKQQTLRSSHKFGFQNAHDFLLVTQRISNYYKDLSLAKFTFTPFSCFNPEMSGLVPSVLAARQSEIKKHLEQYYSKTESIIESFEWDTSFIFGDSNFVGNIKQITTLNFSFSNLKLQNRLVFEMNNEKLNDFIHLLETVLA
ncbi:uncharacterized protein [Drosophila suzukii]|uniref:Uncharacterized protein isoform X1 n=2 Tax=Drosophila suzukii TaxID=28584 RepID=A0ABM4TY74_DROSZ|nr:uncharacterized protein LOC108017433 isoform X1 [Drosophila suzukii]